MKNSLFLILVLFVSSCSLPPTYTGDKFAPTHNVDVYYSAGDIKRDYKIIGHLQSHKYIKTAIEHNLSSFAKKVGGDAVIIHPAEGKWIDADVLRYTR